MTFPDQTVEAKVEELVSKGKTLRCAGLGRGEKRGMSQLGMSVA